MYEWKFADTAMSDLMLQKCQINSDCVKCKPLAMFFNILIHIFRITCYKFYSFFDSIRISTFSLQCEQISNMYGEKGFNSSTCSLFSIWCLCFSFDIKCSITQPDALLLLRRMRKYLLFPFFLLLICIYVDVDMKWMRVAFMLMIIGEWLKHCHWWIWKL